MNLPGVDHIGDLTAFQRMVLIECVRLSNEEEQERIDEAQNGQNGGGRGHTPNAARRPGGGGKRIETKRYTNKSVETDRDPDELIAEYRAENGLEE